MKEKGQRAYEAYRRAGWAWWEELPPDQKLLWAEAEAACMKAAYEDAAKIAKTAWLTCSYGEIADADAMCALSEHTEAAIRSKIGGRAAIPSQPANGRVSPSGQGQSDAQGG